MRSVIKIHKRVLDELIKHCNFYTDLECGGYLYGNYRKSFDTNIITLLGIYYEMRFGSEFGFEFSSFYKSHALKYEEEIMRINGSRLIGCYHSHGQYPAIFSETDRVFEAEWTRNCAALIYSPIEDKLIGDIITTRKEVQSARITVIGQDEFDRLYYPNLPKKSDTKVLLLK